MIYKANQSTMKKFTPFFLVAMLITLSACTPDNEKNQDFEANANETIETEDVTENNDEGLILEEEMERDAIETEEDVEIENAAEDEIIQKNNTNPNTDMSDFDQTALPEKGEQIVVMETTVGTIKIRMFPERAPKTVENFLGLANKGYYDGIIFHRVIPGFMIQGGDPDGNGTGGESFWGGKFDNEPHLELNNIAGSLSMANAGVGPDGSGTNGSQFFINQVDNRFLDGYENGELKDCTQYGVSCHTVFGQVFEGMDVVNAITEVQTGANDKPAEDVVMEKVSVETY